MKIKAKEKSYAEVMALARPERKKPIRPSMLFRTIMCVGSLPELILTGFKLKKINMERLGKKEPCLYLMNHSSFIDMEIVARCLYPRSFNIVCTTDGMIGKNWLMHQIGCIPTKKFLTDSSLVRDMMYALHKLNSSVVLYPEAGYSLDGKATTLPRTLCKCLKLLKVPVVMIRTHGAFSRQPLYNGLQKRKVPISAEMEYILSPEDIAQKSPEELSAILDEQFAFDHFRWQQEEQIRITEPHRADGLNRVLYKCPACGCEGKTKGEGTHLTCTACGKVWEMDELGQMKATSGETEFAHIPDWVAWQRQCVAKELEQGSYKLDCDVDIYMMVDTKSIYHVGGGHLTHDHTGFRLTGSDGQLDYQQKPDASYTINADFYWYELGDIISIGDNDALFYCIPQNCGDVAIKTRLAAEELYKRLAPVRKRRRKSAEDSEK